MSEPGFASLGPSLLARKGGAKPAMRPQVAPLVTGEQPVPEEALEDLGWNDMGHESPGDSLTDSHPGGAGAEIVPIHADIAGDPLTANPGPIVRRQQRRLEERVLADAAMTGPEDREPEYDEDEEEEDGLDHAAAAPFAADLAEEDFADEASDEDDAAVAGDEAIYSPLVSHSPRAAKRAPVLAAAPAAAPAPRSPARARVPAASVGRRAAFTLRLDADRHLKLRLAATMQGVSAQALVTEALDRLLAEHDALDVIANHLKRH